MDRARQHKALRMDSLIEFWFSKKNEHIWFQSTNEDDQMIVTKFGYLIDKLQPLVKDCADCKDIEGFRWTDQELLGVILVYDQISRHVHRFFGQKYPRHHLDIALHFSKKALDRSEMLENWDSKCVGFILLPFRHTCDVTNMRICLQIINKIMTNRESEGEKEEDGFSYMRRFYQATVRDIGRKTEPTIAPPTLLQSHIDKIVTILDPCSVQKFGKNEVKVEEGDVEGDEERDEEKVGDRHLRLDGHPLMKTLSTNMPSGDVHIILSVSGGKDSMALATAMARLRDSRTIGRRIKLSAVHINYMNRDTAVIEEHLVVRYVAHILGIPLYLRRITEIQRSRQRDKRKFYEMVTKEVRFRTYQQIDPDAYVLLGHNRDDCIENIITNLLKKQHYDNLRGMNVISEQMSVKLWRPLLSLPKTEIEDFNKLSLTPFTYDSTPKWSDRGRIRDNVIPELVKFNGGFLESLIELANTFTEMYDSYYEITLPTILQKNVKICRGECLVRFDKQIATVKVMRDIFLKCGILQPSGRSMKNLIEQMRKVLGGKDWKVDVFLNKALRVTIYSEIGDCKLHIPMRE